MMDLTKVPVPLLHLIPMAIGNIQRRKNPKLALQMGHLNVWVQLLSLELTQWAHEKVTM